MTVKTFIFAGACFSLAAFLWANPADATERSNPNSQANAAAKAFAGAAASATGGAGGYVNVDTEKPAASSAIAPSVGTNNDCLVATPASKAGSLVIFSGGGTTGYHYSGLCLAYKMGDMALAEKMMCDADASYAKHNPKCAK